LRRFKFRELLDNTRRNASKDPRDRYFALLGLYGRKSRFGTRLEHGPLKADYSKPLSQVLCDFTKHIIETGRNLTVLYNVGNWREEVDKTSWAAAWRSELDGKHPNSVFEIPAYEATRGSEPRIDRLAYLDMLVIQGIPLGRMLANATTLLRLELESIEVAWKLVI
jgi:hypothetical protein